jgi:LemA protein
MEQTKNNKTGLVVVAVIILLIVWGVTSYNSLISKNEAITAQWAQVDTQLQRRFDLIPNVVAATKGIANQEKEVFTEIAEARTRYAGATTIDEKAAAASSVESSLGRLLVITENYPTLQSSQSFRDITVSLEGSENRISVERMKYNELVGSFNASIKRFPGSIVREIAGLNNRTYFEVSEEATKVPTVDFSN